MKTNQAVVLVFCIVILIFQSKLTAALADSDYMKITLKNGGVFYGKIYEEKDDKIIVEVNSIMISFKKGEIQSIISAETLLHEKKAKPKSKNRLTQVSSTSISGRETVEGFIKSLAKKYKLDSDLIKAIIKTESNFDRFAISCKGAKGLMQLMPQTAKECDVFDIYNPYQNIEGGTRYLRTQLNEFNGDIRLALAAYNAGPESIKKYKGIPPFPETRSYIEKVLRFYNYFKKGGTVIIPKKTLYTFRDKRGGFIITDIPLSEELPIKE